VAVAGPDRHGVVDADDDAPTVELRLDYLVAAHRARRRIVAALADVARSHAGQQLCILCFENVHAGEECHRRRLAEWLETRLDFEVPELPEDPQHPQLPF
jgi:hypothetical protein